MPRAHRHSGPAAGMAIATGALAVLGCGGQRSASPTPPAVAAPRGSRGAATTSAARAFSALARPASPADALPEGALEAVARGQQAGASEGVGIAPDSARTIGAGRPAAWLLGAADELCLLNAVAESRPAPVGYSYTCQTSAGALAGRLLSWAVPVPGHAGETQLVGAVPDGASDVVLHLAAGPPRALQVRDDGYAALARNPLAVTFKAGGAARSVTLGPPRDATPHGPTRGGG